MTRTFKILLPVTALVFIATSPRFSEGIQTVEDQISYVEYLNALDSLKSDIDSGDYRASSRLMYTVINDEIPTYWMGTPWDFNGTSQEPGKGHIACGYFLTTVMKQTGYTIERIKMAQQASSVLIKKYCSDITYLNSLDALRKYLSEQPDSSTYIVGLDFHTGFITKNEKDFYFIHSNYRASRGVVKERITESDALRSNQFFMIGSLDRQEDRMGQWMHW
jgi:hypothetical protein